MVKLKKNNDKKVTFKSIINAYIKFYNKNLKKKHIIVSIIMLVLFFLAISLVLTNIDSLKEVLQNSQIVQNSFFTKLTHEKIPLLAVIIFAGITPFFYLPVLGIGESYLLAFEIGYKYGVNGSVFTIVFGSLGAVIQIIAVSLCIATGIYYCTQGTKKFRYNQHIGFGLKDVKKSIYEIKKDEEKLKQLQEEEMKKAEKREKLNVKIPYINLIISFVIGTIVLIIGSILSLI